MATIREFRDLEVWQLSRALCQQIFERIVINGSIKDFPLKDQMNRSSGSVMDNIAEGFGRGGNKEFRHFLAIAKGSLCELESQIFRASDRNYLKQGELESYVRDVVNIKGKLVSFSNYLSRTELKGFKYKAEEPEGAYNQNFQFTESKK